MHVRREKQRKFQNRGRAEIPACAKPEVEKSRKKEEVEKKIGRLEVQEQSLSRLCEKLIQKRMFIGRKKIDKASS